MSGPPEPPRGGLLSAVRESLSGVQHDYTSGDIHRAIVLLAVPMVLEMAMESVFAVCDVFFVARLGSDAVATVGLTESVLTLVYAVAIGLSMSVTATVARRIGEGDRDGARVAAVQGLALGGVLALLAGVPAWFLAEDVLRAMGASDAVVAGGSGYTRVLLGSNVVIMLLFLHNAVFRGAGDATVAMRSLWLANGINLVLDPCLIFGLGPFPELGVTGAAIATTIGRGAGVVYQMRALSIGSSRIHLARRDLVLDLAVIRRLIRVSLGGVGQYLVATASWVALFRIMASFGSAALAGYTIAIRIVVFAILPAWGLSNAAATLVGQNLGAGRPERAERSVWITGFYNMGFLALVTLVFTLLAGPLVRVFTDEPEVVAIGTTGLRTMSYGYVFYAWAMVMGQAFNGAGDTATPTRMNLACFWAVQIPLAYVLAHPLGYGPSGVFWAVMLSESLLAVVAMALFRRGRWKQQQV